MGYMNAKRPKAFGSHRGFVCQPRFAFWVFGWYLCSGVVQMRLSSSHVCLLSKGEEYCAFLFSTTFKKPKTFCSRYP